MIGDLHPTSCAACGGLADDDTHPFATEADLEAEAVDIDLGMFTVSNAAVDQQPIGTIDDVLAAAAELEALAADVTTHLAACGPTIGWLKSKLQVDARTAGLDFSSLPIVRDDTVPAGLFEKRTGPRRRVEVFPPLRFELQAPPAADPFDRMIAAMLAPQRPIDQLAGTELDRVASLVGVTRWPRLALPLDHEPTAPYGWGPSLIETLRPTLAAFERAHRVASIFYDLGADADPREEAGRRILSATLVDAEDVLARAHIDRWRLYLGNYEDAYHRSVVRSIIVAGGELASSWMLTTSAEGLDIGWRHA